ncbi:hypothetical protein C942_04340 [Photobacterium marinum]|uniref:Uncharacterized protein n=1 Tax=Photobacterium marinum TaxID=1056511 RepID=L8JGU4_9GAMM|nr:hypothetical protein [Photobacterium marinum]ELR66642.1 hypothetical protein C942_04340 [Photobacterium marinum]
MKNVLLATALTALLSLSSFYATAETEPVTFQDIPEVMAEFYSAKVFRKKAFTLGRLPHPSEIGRDIPTYVADENGKPKLETENVISSDVVIARNPEPVSGAVFNEWLVPKEKWQETYGELPDQMRFMPFQRAKTIKAIPITDDILTLLGSEDGETAIIAVEWNEQGMTVYKDGYLTDGGYGIAPAEMTKTYEEID